MIDEPFTSSPSGVRIAGDFRDNLIIDRYDPVFACMRAGKLEHLRSENSEDAVTWNVFRSLRQLDAHTWLPALLAIGLPNAKAPVAHPSSSSFGAPSSRHRACWPSVRKGTRRLMW